MLGLERQRRSWATTARRGRSTPVAVRGIATAVAVTASGTAFSCAVLASGAVQCWGSGGYGELGDGEASPPGIIPLTVANLDDAVTIDSGSSHTCVLRKTGGISCWGQNGVGQLGIGRSGPNTGSSVPVPVMAISTAVQVDCGSSHTCAILDGGTVQCWGEFRDLPSPRRHPGRIASTPQTVAGIASAVGITGGLSSACALLGDGTVKCWGDNRNGQLGNGSANDSDPPTPVVGLGNVAGINCQFVHSCALLGNGSVRCWGANDYGQLGNGTMTGTRVPVPVVGF